MPAIPFVGGLYDYAHGPGANISQLLLERGRAQADSAARIGQIWGNTVANLGQIGGQTIERDRENKRNEALSGVMAEYIQNPDATPEMAYANTLRIMHDPKSALQVAQGLVAFKRASHPDTPPEVALGELPSIYDAYKAAPAGMKPGIWHTIKQGLGSKIDMSQLPDAPTPEAEKFVSQYVDTLRKKEVTPEDLYAQEKAKAAGKAAGTPPEAPKIEKTPEQIFAEAKARAAGERAGNPPQPPKVGEMDPQLRLSYNHEDAKIQTIAKPLREQGERFSRLVETVNQKTPAADALVAPELLTVMAGGIGSGLRMNEAEISRIVHGRTNWENLKAAVNKWQLDPSKGLSITDDQRAQIRDLIGSMYQRITKRVDLIDKAAQDLVDAKSIQEQRQVSAGLQSELNKISNPEDSSAPKQGDKKTFPNGRVGVWDGQGWVAQ